jgi:hypothetical protein
MNFSGDGADLLDGIPILKPVEQVPHFGATRVELLVAVLVVAEDLAAGGVKVEDAAVRPVRRSCESLSWSRSLRCRN